VDFNHLFVVKGEMKRLKFSSSNGSGSMKEEEEEEEEVKTYEINTVNPSKYILSF